MENIFFMVYLEGERTPAYKHESLFSAETEAKRLASTYNRKSHVLLSLKSFEINHVKEEVLFDLSKDRLPF